jgi:integrase/recombinase XerD
MLSAEEQAAYELVLELMPRLAFKKLSVLRRESRKQIKERYRKNHGVRKRGNIDPSFSHEEYQRFMRFLKNPKAYLANKLMHDLGCRVGEVVIIKLEDIDFLRRNIIIHTLKGGDIRELPLHDEIFEFLRDWVNRHHAAILHHGGHILFSGNPTQKRQHVSENWLRRYFRDCRAEAGLDQTYGLSTEKNGRTPRRLYLKIQHSHRHGFGTNLWEITGDVQVVQHALGHKDPKSTTVYIHPKQEYVRSVIMQAYRKQPPLEPLEYDN